jgi:multidrug resistance efflux pump
VVPGAVWTLSFPVDGTLVSQAVERGGRVATDQVLAVLDPEPFEARVSDRAAALEAAERRRVGGYMDPDAMRAMLPSVVAPERFDALRVAVLRAELGVATAGLELRRAVLDNSAAALRAPGAVQVQRWLAAPGQRLRAGTPVVEVADVSSVRVVMRAGPSWRAGTRVIARRADGTPLPAWVGPASPDDPGVVPVMIPESVDLPVGERLRISVD